MQSMQILDQGLKTYTANNPHRVSELDHDDPIRVQIEEVLKTETTKASGGTPMSPMSSTTENIIYKMVNFSV